MIGKNPEKTRRCTAPLVVLSLAWVSVSGSLFVGCSRIARAAEPPIFKILSGAPPQTNSIGMKMVLIPAGEFVMGSNDGPGDEKPPHKVRITKPFYLGQYEVTVGQFRKFVEESKQGGRNDAETKYDVKLVQPATWRNAFPGQSDDYPVVRVSWIDANAFCDWLFRKEGKEYRLPTEAEWEYACRAGTQTKWCFGDNEGLLEDYAWYGETTGKRARAVGRKKPNAWGLYDMYGNASEWCADWYAENYYASSPAADPNGPSSGKSRVIRGGSYDYVSYSSFDPIFKDRQGRASYTSGTPPPCSTARSGTWPDMGNRECGFRVARNKEATSLLPGTLFPARANVTVETNSIGMKMVLVPAGEFIMGSSNGESDEKPLHNVRITRPFYLGQFHVTVGQFRQFVEESKYDSGTGWRNAFVVQTDECPVVNMNWNDATAFCEWLSKREGKKHRLPTEAEWEYACRAGTQTKWSFGENEDQLGDYAWYNANSGEQTHPVGRKKPNAWGFYDMHGNAYEWCADRHDSRFYASSPADDPNGPSSGEFRVLRGGSWCSFTRFTRCAIRHKYLPDTRNLNFGFRVARNP